MDPAVALVQAYLQLSGYLTVAEFPIVAASAEGVETITDVDLIAVRFPLVQPLGAGPAHESLPDARLGVSAEGMDLLICEVKEGRAHVNPNLNRADTLRATLERIGCCAPGHVDHHVQALLRRGTAEIDHAGGIPCRVRLAVFAGRASDARPVPVVISLAHVAREVCRFLQEHREALHAMRLTQPALAHLHLLEKVGVLRGDRSMAPAPDA